MLSGANARIVMDGSRFGENNGGSLRNPHRDLLAFFYLRNKCPYDLVSRRTVFESKTSLSIGSMIGEVAKARQFDSSPTFQIAM